ncbi:hypothetical protein PsYK624_130450 [Phanerochaete sordida]|uniref:Uncharacterized protein n=1 Tax=Phanerochaete sordida TaxID=48140 RepID=A0A9P3LJ33_9APHY|nr:hypothetical protein PsYK624_130450 [Phanerochaete sordida]
MSLFGYHRLILILTSVAVSFFTLARGALVNVTVDDDGSDLTTGARINYEGDWAIGPACVNSTIDCEASLDATQVRDGTWHGTTYDPSISSQTIPGNATFSFTGTAIYAFGIRDGARDLELTFFLDEQEAGNLLVPRMTSYTYQYNQLYFKAEGLSNTAHFWRMQNGLGSGTTISVALLDYLVYTCDSAETSSAISSATTSLTTTDQQTSAPSATSPAITTGSMAKSSTTGPARTTVTAVSVSVAIMVLVFLILLAMLYKARKDRQRPKTGIADHRYLTMRAHAAGTGGTGGDPQRGNPAADALAAHDLQRARGRYSVAPFTLAFPGAARAAPRATEKMWGAPVSLRAPPASRGGQREAGRPAAEAVHDVIWDSRGARGSVSSIARWTAPPVYQSEIGGHL